MTDTARFIRSTTPRARNIERDTIARGTGATVVGAARLPLDVAAPIPGVVHQPDCNGCGSTYECNACERVCGWCFGCGDDMPDICDDCWMKYDDVGDDD